MQGTRVNYISTTDLSEYNPTLDLSRYTDTTLSGVVSRASAWVDSYLGYTLTYETLSNEKTEGRVDADGNLVIFPKKFPVDTLSAVAITKGTQTIDFELLDGATPRYDIIPSDLKSQIIFPNNELALSGSARVASFYDIRTIRFYTKITYNAGYQSIPADIKDAVNLIATDYLSRSLNPTGATSISQGAVSYTFASSDGGDSDKIRDAKQILSRYRRVTGW